MFITITPKAVDFWDNTAKSTASAIKKAGGYDIVFNASFFNNTPGKADYFKPNYVTKCNGKVLSSEIYTCSKYGYAWNDGEIPRVMKAEDAIKDTGVDNFLTAIWAVLDGKAYPLDAPRDINTSVIVTYFGMKANDDMVIGCENISIKQAQQKLLDAGCISGIILDGGGSSQLLTDTGSIASTRKVRTLVCVKLKTSDLKVIEPNYSWAYALTPRKTTTHMILHHAAAETATADTIHNYHKSLGWAGIAYHYFVRKDGTIYRGRPENMTGGHTQNMNYCSIGICFEGNFDNETMPEAQATAGQLLVADILRRNPSITVVGKHSQFNATGCPGKNFPFTIITDPIDGSVEDDNDVETVNEAASEWAETAWEWAKANYITDGTDPQGAVTREQVITMIYRARGK